MEKSKKQQGCQQQANKFFPNFKKSYSATKNAIVLSKVQLDKNMTSIQYLNPKPTRQIVSSLSHKRIISGINSGQYVHAQFSKTQRKFCQQTFQRAKSSCIGQQKNSSIGSGVSLPQRQSLQNAHTQCIVQKAKVSSKSIGFIKGYSVNSHPGPISVLNEDRICVVTNLNKSSHKQQQISFFSIYDGGNGVAKAEYFRDHLHTTLIRDKQFNKDIEGSIKKAIASVQQNFQKTVEQIQFPPTVNILIVIIIQCSAYFISVGQNKVIASFNFGSEVYNPLDIKQQVKKVTNHKQKNRNKSLKLNIKVLKIDLRNVDFIILGSEGLHQKLDEKTITTKTWKHLLEKIEDERFHNSLGETTNEIMKLAFERAISKNISVILIVFENVFQCFRLDCITQIPYVKQYPQASQEDISK